MIVLLGKVGGRLLKYFVRDVGSHLEDLFPNWPLCPKTFSLGFVTACSRSSC
jgi:hypothetical protein